VNELYSLVGVQELTFSDPNQTYVRVWADYQKQNQITGFPITYDHSNPFPIQMWVEGYECGEATMIFKHHYLDGSKTRTDRVKLTVFKIEINEPNVRPLGSPDDPPPVANDITYTCTISPSSIPSKDLEWIKFSLYGLSTEPGYCMNSEPQTGYAHDLVFVFAGGRNSGYNNGGDPTGVIAFKDNPNNTETVDVSSRDYGAYGMIAVDVKIAGTVYRGHVLGDGSRLFARVPKDDNENHISDACTTHDNGIAIDDTDSAPVGDGDPGDGLSRYQ
jgi:hypothetical protein